MAPTWPGAAQTGLVDQYGSPYRAPRDPLGGQSREARAGAVLRDVPAIAVDPGWTVTAIRDALNALLGGQFASSAILCDAIAGDDRIHAALGSRVEALLGLPLEYVPAPGGDEVLAAWQRAYPRCAPASVLGEIKRWAVLLGFGVAEILWDTDVTPWQPYLKPWHPQHVWYEWQTRRLIANTLDGPVPIVPGDGRWLVHAPHGIYRGWVQGAVRALALPWLLRNQAQRDWARYCEVHGLPTILAYLPAMADEMAKAGFVSSLAARGGEAVISLPQELDGTGFDLKMLEATSNTWQGFQALVSKCDMAITLALQGQNLAGGAEVKEGSLATARVHADVKQSKLEFDDAMLAHDIREQLARPFAAWNFGDAELAPYTHYDVQSVEDRSAEVLALESFGRAVGSLVNAGVPVDVPAMARSYGIQVPTTAGTLPGEPAIFGYHLEARVVKRDEMRKRLGLDPIGGDVGDELLGPAATDGAPPTPPIPAPEGTP